jgi:iron complex transport system substrate-binding protein
MRVLPVLLLALSALFGAGRAGHCAAPSRVVSQTVGTDDLLAAIAAPGQIAALSHLARDPRYSPTAAANAQYPCLRNGEAEDILRFRPDLVLVASYTQAETVVLLRRANVETLEVDHFDTLEELYGNARRIGRALGREARADELIKQWQARVKALGTRLKGCRPVRVLAVGFYPFTAGAGTTFQDLCEHAGALNVAAEAGLKGHVPTPNEKILTWQVDVLVAPGEAGLDMQARLKDLAPYKFMKAFREGRVVQLPSALMAATSQARLDAYEALARALHPEAFR